MNRGPDSIKCDEKGKRGLGAQEIRDMEVGMVEKLVRMTRVARQSQ